MFGFSGSQSPRARVPLFSAQNSPTKHPPYHASHHTTHHDHPQSPYPSSHPPCHPLVDVRGSPHTYGSPTNQSGSTPTFFITLERKANATGITARTAFEDTWIVEHNTPVPFSVILDTLVFCAPKPWLILLFLSHRTPSNPRVYVEFLGRLNPSKLQFLSLLPQISSFNLSRVFTSISAEGILEGLA